jgi:hypothetical protein
MASSRSEYQAQLLLTQVRSFLHASIYGFREY